MRLRRSDAWAVLIVAGLLMMVVGMCQGVRAVFGPPAQSREVVPRR